MLSSKGKYAVRATTMLAEQFEAQAWISTVAIAKQEDIPRKFLEAILVQLRDGGLVDSRRGPQGGHRLARAPATISVADVMRLIDGPLALTPCASVTRFRPCIDCADIRTCRMQHVMRQARDALAEVLENCSLSSLAAPPIPHPDPFGTKPTSDFLPSSDAISTKQVCAGQLIKPQSN